MDEGNFTLPLINTPDGILLSLYGLLIFTGLILNISLATILLCRCLCCNVTNCLILILTISDILLCGICTPLQTMYEVLNILERSKWLCKLLFAFFGMPLQISCLTVLLIAVDRYRLILHPLLPRMNFKCAILCVAGIVFVSVLNSLPIAIYGGSLEFPGIETVCHEFWPSPLFRSLYSILVPCFLVIIPLLTTAFLYYRIYVGLRQSRKNPRMRRSQLHERRYSRINTILFCNVLCFIICWLPWTLYSMILEITVSRLNQPTMFDNQSHSSEYIFVKEDGPRVYTNKLDICLKMLCMLSTCINPILYGWINSSIRNKLKLKPPS